MEWKSKIFFSIWLMLLLPNVNKIADIWNWYKCHFYILKEEMKKAIEKEKYSYSIFVSL